MPAIPHVIGTLGNTPSSVAGPLTALDWSGDGGGVGGPTRRMIVWQDPHLNGMPCYGPLNGAGPDTLGATYFFRIKPFRKDTSTTSVSRVTVNERYWTTYFWGNSNPDGGEWTTGGPTGIFSWDAGNPNTYHGVLHPYPDGTGGGGGPPFGIPQYPEISVEALDFTTHNITGTVDGSFIAPGATDDELSYGNWQWIVGRVRKSSSTDFEHECYYKIEVNNAGMRVAFSSATWAATNPPHPVITVGQSAWCTYTGNEEFCGAIGAMIMVPQWVTSLTDCRSIIANTTNAGVKSTLDSLGLPNEWYLNMSPTTTDISDKGRRGNHPIWVGNGRPADVAGG